MDPLNDRLLDPPHQPLEGLVRWVCDEPASLTPESVLTGTKERIGCSLVLLSQRAQCVVKPPLRAKSHQGLFLGLAGRLRFRSVVLGFRVSWTP